MFEKRMRRIVGAIMIVLTLANCFAVGVYAQSSNKGISLPRENNGFEITKKEFSVVSDLIRQFGYGGTEISVKPLLGSDNMVAYLLAVSENGYLIVERDGYRFCQCGEGNPYAGYEGSLCYYGGPFCYYTAAKTVVGAPLFYYDIYRGEYTEKFVTLERNSESNVRSATRGSDNLSEVRLPNSFDYIRRIAFGFNNDNTCSAVATGIALSYIARSENMRVVSDSHIAETLTKKVGCVNDAKKDYPCAYNLHRYIVSNAGMGGPSWGAGVDNAIGKYFNLLEKNYPISKNYQLDASWTLLPKADTIRQNISEGRPVVITDSFFGGKYALHTMCVYGHKRVNGDDALLVHTGWWNQDFEREFTYEYVNGTSVLAKSELWIDESWATYGYYFSYNNPLKVYKDKDMPSFTDYTYDGILHCVVNKIMIGTSATLFSPNVNLDRGQIAVILYKAAGAPPVTGSEPFEDVKPSHYYYDAVRWAYNNKLVVGTSTTTYSPSMKLTREQLALMLLGLARYLKKNTTISSDHSYIHDYNTASSWAKDGLRWAASHGILVPKDGKYRPIANATRAEAAYAIYALLEKCS